MNLRERIRTAILVLAWFHASITIRIDPELASISIVAALAVTLAYVIRDVSDLRAGTLPTRIAIAKSKRVDDISRRIEAQRRSWQPNEPS